MIEGGEKGVLGNSYKPRSGTGNDGEDHLDAEWFSITDRAASGVDQTVHALFLRGLKRGEQGVANQPRVVACVKTDLSHSTDSRRVKGETSPFSTFYPQNPPKDRLLKFKLKLLL